jgi:hypothetical protein
VLKYSDDLTRFRDGPKPLVCKDLKMLTIKHPLVCTVQIPRLDAWIFLLSSHVILFVVGGIPLALWAFHVGRRLRRLCIPVA